MSPRPRIQQNRGLPENLYTQVKGGQTYYRYRHPVTSKYHGLGKDKREAVRAARILNNRLMSTPTAEELIAEIEAPSTKYQDYVDHFLNDVVPRRLNRRGKPLSPRTVEEYQRYLALSTKRWGPRALSSVTRLDVTEFLATLTANSALHARSVLTKLFAQAVGEGHLESSPVDGTLKPEIHVQRARLTEAEFDTIRAAAGIEVQLLLDLTIETLQRRSDLVRLTRDDLFDDKLHVRQQKTGVNVRMPLPQDLIDRLPASGRLVQINGKPCTTDQITRTFARLRDKCGVRADLPSRQKPSFHELRALGARLLEERGVDPQARLGHLEGKTTRIYLDRHQEKWIDVD